MGSESIGEERFREDLYYRLAIVVIPFPPLRERKEDILPLARYFVKRFTQESPPQYLSIRTENKNQFSGSHPFGFGKGAYQDRPEAQRFQSNQGRSGSWNKPGYSLAENEKK